MMSNSVIWQKHKLFDEGEGNDALIWFKYWRPPIETLMNGSHDNYYAALQLMYPCMERMYQLKESKVGEKGLTKEVLRYFFPRGEGFAEENYEQVISTLTNSLRHGLAHDAFVRDGVDILGGALGRFCAGLRVNSSPDMAISANFINPIIPHNDSEGVSIDVKILWHEVKKKIDDYYTSSDYLVNHYMQDLLVQMFNAVLEHEKVKLAEDLQKKLNELGIITEDNQ